MSRPGKHRPRNRRHIYPGSYGRQTVVSAACPRSGERSYDSYRLPDTKGAEDHLDPSAERNIAARHSGYPARILRYP